MSDEYAVYKDGRRIGTARKTDPVGDAVGGAAGCLIWLAVLAAIFLVVPLAISLLAPFVTTLPRMLSRRENRKAVAIAVLVLTLLVPVGFVIYAVAFPTPVAITRPGPEGITEIYDSLYGWDAYIWQYDGLLPALEPIAFATACLSVVVYGSVRRKWLKQTGKGIALVATAYGKGVANFWRWLVDKIFGGGQSTSAERAGRGTGEVDVQLIRDLMRAHAAAAGNKLAQDALLEKVAAEFRRAGVDSDEASSILHDVLNSSK